MYISCGAKCSNLHILCTVPGSGSRFRFLYRCIVVSLYRFLVVAVISYRPRRCKTATYQRSFFIRATRTWNSLPEHLRLDHLSLTLFKKSLLEYYHNALVSCYDVDDARTWKTVCLKCNTSRNLIDADPCCY